MVKTRTDFWSKSTLLGLGLGQILPLLVTYTGFTSSELAKKGIFAPSSLCFLNYVLLALVYGGIMLHRREPLKVKLYFYVMLALVDVFAKYFVIEAFQYTSLTSIMLLDCWTIPCVLLLAWLFLKVKYGLQKLVGVAICVAGLVTVVLSDVHFADRSSGINPLKGDLLIIVGATLYGVSNVSEEFFFKKADRVELMALLGIFGAILTAPQITVFEHDVFKSILSSPATMFPFIGYSLAMFLFYSGFPLLVKIRGSSMLNLSLLTSNISAVLIRIFAYHEKVDWIYFVGLAAVTLGLDVYLRGDEIDPNNGEAVAIEKEAKGVGLGHSNNAGVSNKDGSRISFQGEIDPNSGEAAAIEKEAKRVCLGHSNNAGVSNKDGSRISFQGARNSLCYVMK